MPFEPYLYNASNQTGLSVHGRPGGFGSSVLYQIGEAVNDQVNTDGTKENRYDTYVMGRYAFMVGGVTSQISAFYYKAPNAAISTLNMDGTVIYADQATDIERWGVGARGQWGEWDVYGTYITDSITAPGWVNSGNAMAPNSVWETDGLKTLPGGTLPLNVNASFLASIVK